MGPIVTFFFFSSRRRHTRLQGDWSSDVCSSDLLLVRNAELRLAQAGGNIRMRLCVDVRIDPQGDRRALAHALRDLIDALELGLRLDVDAADTLLEGELDLRRALADAGEECLARIASRRHHARELAAGNDVEAGAELGKQRQDREIRIRLDRIADERVPALEGLRVFTVCALDRGARID